MNSSQGYRYLDGYAYILIRILEISSHYLLRILNSISPAKTSALPILFFLWLFFTGLLPNSWFFAIKTAKKKYLILSFPLENTKIFHGYLFISEILFLTLNRLTINSALAIHRQLSQKEFSSLNPSSSFRYQQELDGIMDRIISMGILWGWPLILGIKLKETRISMNCMCGFLKQYHLALLYSLNVHTQEKPLICVKDLVKNQSRAFFLLMQKSRSMFVLGIKNIRLRKVLSALEKTNGIYLGLRKQ